jgi:surface antigen
MVGRIHASALLALATVAGPAGAIGGGGGDPRAVGVPRLPPYLQCVPYVRQVTGVRIYGDAHSWWNQAEGRYGRGATPKVGAVMAFRAHGGSRLGHVAAVSRIVDSRTVLISHANWSPIQGRRGQIERNVKAVDVSANNDWSRVRVWFAPIKALGSTAWPLAGFIYNTKPGAKPATPQLGKVARTAEEKAALVKGAAAKPRKQPPFKDRDPIGEIIARGR